MITVFVINRTVRVSVMASVELKTNKIFKSIDLPQYASCEPANTGRMIEKDYLCAMRPSTGRKHTSGSQKSID
jgi:hypothetical protein